MVTTKNYKLQLYRNSVVFATKDEALTGLKTQMTTAEYGEVRIATYTDNGTDKVLLAIKGIQGYQVFEGATIASNGKLELPEEIEKKLQEIQGVIEAGVISDIKKEGDVITATKGESNIDLTLDYSTSMPDDLTTPNAVGGVAKGISAETLKTKTLSQILDMILFPELQPTIVAPSASIALKGGFANGGIYEVGAPAPTVDTHFTLTFNRGTSTVAGQPTKNRAGAIINESSFVYYGGNVANKTLPTTVALGATSYNYHVEYEQGDECVTSYGNKASVTPNPLTAGSVNSGAVSINGAYPYFCNGVTASTTANETSNLPSSFTPDNKLPLILNTATSIAAKFASEDSSTRVIFDFPATKKVTAVEVMNPASGQWTAFSGWTTAATTNKTIQGNSIAYNRLTTNGGLSGAMQLKFTIANA